MKNGNWNKRILALLLALALSLGILAGCTDRQDDPADPSEGEPEELSQAEVEEEQRSISSVMSDQIPAVQDMKGENEDTVGWLYVPGTKVDDVVVQSTQDNFVYERLGFDKQESFNGVFYADFRCQFGSGAAEEISPNLVIYGHALTDDKSKDSYEIKFGTLHDFRTPSFARENPYIFYTTESENLVYEIFAVFVANADNTIIPYNDSSLSQEEVYDMVINEVLPRSMYNYEGIDIQPDDKFITLSTCIYTLENGVETGYPKTYMRYAIMGRLVDPEGTLKKEATLTRNRYMVIDDDGALNGVQHPAASYDVVPIEYDDEEEELDLEGSENDTEGDGEDSGSEEE